MKRGNKVEKKLKYIEFFGKKEKAQMKTEKLTKFRDER